MLEVTLDKILTSVWLTLSADRGHMAKACIDHVRIDLCP